MRKTLALLAALAVLSASLAPASAQQPTQTPAPAPQTSPARPQPQPQPTPPTEVDEEDVVRITTNLVQLDAEVLDKHGKQVTDLKPEDFEVLEDGKPQKITNCSYINTETPASANLASAAPAPKPDKNAPPAPPVPPRRLRPEQVRRAVALVIDDLLLSAADLIFARRAAREYVDKYVAPDDLVAVIRTSAGAGALQQFTSDKRQLYAALERVRPYLGGNGLSTFAPIQGDPTGGARDPGDARASQGSRDSKEGGDSKDDLDNFRQEYFSVGTLGALGFVINGMRELPGRKTVVLFSPGFAMHSTDAGDGRGDRAFYAARRIVDQANRAAVVIYTVDPRGLVYTGPTAADDLSGMSGRQVSDMMASRSQQLLDTQEGAQFLAEQTGGFFVHNSNNLLPAKRILEDQKGYYLIGYRPQGETFNRRFHRLSVRLVNHRELTVRARKGFYGVSTEQLRPASRTRAQKFVAALMSPLSAGDIRLQLTGLFTNTPKYGSLVSATMHVDARDLQLARQPDGWYEGSVDLLGVTFSDAGTVVDQRGITQKLRLREDVYQRVQREGIVYTINVPIKKPGAYQLRVALRDNANDRLGSASQFIEVPDLKKNRLALSGVVVSGVVAGSAAAKAGGEDAAQPVSEAKEGASEAGDTESSAAVRRFHQRGQVDYACVIFNARTDKAHAAPQLTARAQLYRDGQPVFAGKDMPVPVSAQTDPSRVVYGGRLTLGTDLPPGDYVLQIVVTDALRDDKHGVASQWIDFEIVK
jgi:VWFA-related protein